ncbi:unnamed protein product [Durusdinium trenchii]|uniref:OTU domain-containing protein n=1 Tax=Durusdinium trenchii TaxID=1381693 RepID=A0ABP0R8U6_9DINO
MQAHLHPVTCFGVPLGPLQRTPRTGRPQAQRYPVLALLQRSACGVLALSAGRFGVTQACRVRRTVRFGMVQDYPAHEVRMTDQEILQNLKERHGWSSQDKGAGGNCLFLSMAPQITAKDVEESLGSELAEKWKDMPLREKASQLRRLAILDETKFITELKALSATSEPLPSPVEWRLRELFTDMAEEFISSNKTELAAGILPWDREGLYRQVRKVVAEYSLDQMCEYVLKHADEYLQTTGKDGNWAGSSEMAGLSRVVKRPILAYGNNNVSEGGLKMKELEDGSKEVLPYFEARCFSEARGDPIKVFQTYGGGHYQMLS